MALLVPSKPQTTDLEMIVRVLPNDLCEFTSLRRIRSMDAQGTRLRRF